MSNIKIQLRPYQQDIVTQTINSNKHTLIQVPTGGGKTVISRFIAFDLAYKQDKQVLFVAPKLVLMEQTLQAFKDINPQKVHGTEYYNPKHKILVSTLQTASRREELQPDIIIIDEIHHGYDGSMIEKLIKNKPHTRVIGLSATPYDRKGKLLKGFKLILNKYDMNYMIKHNFLVGLKSYVLVRQDLSEIKITAGDYNLSELSQVVCNKNTILEIIETSKKFILESKKTIVFAVDIIHAELLTKAYIEKGFNAKALHSKIKKDEVKKEIELFREGKTQVLVSVLMLTTGFDVPDTDCAVIARPTKSQNLYKQMVGRVLRIASDKDSAILLDCGNVIENLGMPLEPIHEVSRSDTKNNNKQKCSSCGTEDIKLIKQDNKLYWECQNQKCLFLREVKQSAYECKNCHLIHSHTSNYIFENDKIILNCECGFKTVISEYKKWEVFFEVDKVLEENPWIKNILKWSVDKNLSLESFTNKKILNLRELNTLNRKIDYIPKEIGNLINLKELHLNNNLLTELPKEIGNLTKLKYLYLNNTQLTRLPEKIINLKNLKKIMLNNNPDLLLSEKQKEWLKELKKNKCKIYLDEYIDIRTKDEEWMTKLETWGEKNEINFLIPMYTTIADLRIFHGGNSKLDKIPKEIGNLINLKKLYLYDNNLKELPSEITNLKNLKEIMLNNNPDLVLSEKQKEWLAELKRNKCNVSIDIKIDYSIYKKVKLIETPRQKELFFEKVKKWNTKNSNIFLNKKILILDEKLEFIPKEIEQFRKLEELDLSGNSIEVLPNEIINLTNLKRLSLNRNKLTEIPTIISQLVNLEELWLNYNNIKSLPPEIINLKKLKVIMLTHNSKDFSFTEEQKEWLIELMEYGCLLGIQSKIYRKLLKEKEEIKKLKKDKLQDELILFENKWIEKLLKWKENNTKVSLPKTYKEIINLEELNITSSNVDYIPHEIGNLINLKKLYVSDNSLNELPFEIRNLHNLTHLWLGNNNLVQLPKEIVNLKNLQEILLDGNRNLVLSEEQKEWLRELESNQCEIYTDIDYSEKEKIDKEESFTIKKKEPLINKFLKWFR